MKKLLQNSVNALPASVRYWIKHIPVAAAAQRWLVKHLLSGQPIVHVINDGLARSLRFEVALPVGKAIWAGYLDSFKPRHLLDKPQ